MKIESLIVDIIRTEMGFKQSNIWITKQNRKIPDKSEEMFCAVGVTDFFPISSKSTFDPDTNQEIQTVYGRANVQIDIFSRSNEARQRRHEVLMALNSFYSKNIQDKYCFRIFEIPKVFTNTSGLQGGSDINRFTVIIPTMVSEEKTHDTPYYDQFSGSLMTEDTEIDLKV